MASFSLQMGQFSNPVATHPRTNEVEVPPPPRGAHLSQKYPFTLLKPSGISMKRYQGLSNYPSSTISAFYEHLMLLSMNLTSNHLNYNIQRKQNDSFTVFADCKKTMPACEKLSSVLEMWNFQELSMLVLSSDYHSYAHLIRGIFV